MPVRDEVAYDDRFRQRLEHDLGRFERLVVEPGEEARPPSRRTPIGRRGVLRPALEHVSHGQDQLGQAAQSIRCAGRHGPVSPLRSHVGASMQTWARATKGSSERWMRRRAHGSID